MALVAYLASVVSPTIAGVAAQAALGIDSIFPLTHCLDSLLRQRKELHAKPESPKEFAKSDSQMDVDKPQDAQDKESKKEVVYRKT